MGFNVLQATWGSEDLHQNSSKLLWARNMFSLRAAPLCAFFFSPKTVRVGAENRLNRK